MTDGEPEPFRMPTDPDATDAEPADAEPAEAEPTDAGTESIADLIDEAARTASEQTEAEAQGQVPDDRSADIWGDGADDTDEPDHDTDAVWQQTEDDADTAVWDTDDGGGDAMWGSDAPESQERTSLADDGSSHEPSAAPPTSASPAAAEGMPGTSDEIEPETFAFAIDDGSDTSPPATSGPPTADGGAPDEEPEAFDFPAGPQATAPAPVPDQPDADEEPEAFSFPVSDGTAESTPTDPTDPTGAAATEPTEEWTAPGAGAADGEDDVTDMDEVDDDVWRFSAATGDEAPLADTATPREDAGWHDLEAEQEPAWSVPDLPVRAQADDEDEDTPEGFTVAVDDEYNDDDDAPWSAPALPDEPAMADEDLPPADGVTTEVHDALGDLLVNGPEDAVDETGGPVGGASAPAAASADDPAPTDTADDTTFDLDDLDHLDDLDDLEHLDDMAAAAVPTEDDQPAGAPGDGEDAPPDAEQPMDAPTAARKVMEPGSVTFSSSDKKKRGLFR